jgi:hypothetical protein
MGTAGSVLGPHDPPCHEGAVPGQAPLQHLPYPA